MWCAVIFGFPWWRATCRSHRRLRRRAQEWERNSGLPGGDREGFSSRRLAYARGRIRHTHVHVMYGHSYSAYACAGPQVLGPHLRHEQAAVPAAAVRAGGGRAPCRGALLSGRRSRRRAWGKYTCDTGECGTESQWRVCYNAAVKNMQDELRLPLFLSECAGEKHARVLFEYCRTHRQETRPMPMPMPMPPPPPSSHVNGVRSTLQRGR